MNPFNVIPMVIEQGSRSERAYDIYSLLLKNRIVMLGSEIRSEVANLIVAQLLFLDGESPEKPVRIYIQSPGGDVYAGMAIYDAMQQITAPVSTMAIGRAASFGTVVLAGGAAGMRYALPNATIHMHQPWGGAQGQVTDMMIQVQEYSRLKERLIQIFMEHTHQERAVIERDTERDIFFNPEQAVEYGLVDAVFKTDKAHLNGHTNGQKAISVPEPVG